MIKKYPTLNLKFPSGRSIEQLRKDAKRIQKEDGVTLSQALDVVAKSNGATSTWANEVGRLKRTLHGSQSFGSVTKRPTPERKVNRNTKPMNPYRKLLVLALNEMLERGILTLNTDTVEEGYFITIIAGETTVVRWNDIGCGEVSFSVWWKYDHKNHPQKDGLGSTKERFQIGSPLAKRHHYPKFVGVVASAWLERENGPYIQGTGSNYLNPKYMRKGERAHLDLLPTPTPKGFAAEGRFHR